MPSFTAQSELGLNQFQVGLLVWRSPFLPVSSSRRRRFDHVGRKIIMFALFYGSEAPAGPPF